MSLLELQHVYFEDAGKTILQDVSIQIEKGEFLSVIGPSGSGKSTFLKLCSSLISPSGGRIFFRGKDFLTYQPADLRKRLAYCFQMPCLFGSTVRENLVFPYTIRDQKPDTARMEELLAMFHMSSDYLDRSTENLSGGEKQRLALIRSLLVLPEVLLLDEVTSALDGENARITEDMITSLHKDGMTVLWVTHSPEQIGKYADRTVTIEAGQIKSIKEAANEYDE